MFSGPGIHRPTCPYFVLSYLIHWQELYSNNFSCQMTFVKKVTDNTVHFMFCKILYCVQVKGSSIWRAHCCKAVQQHSRGFCSPKQHCSQLWNLYFLLSFGGFVWLLSEHPLYLLPSLYFVVYGLVKFCLAFYLFLTINKLSKSPE